MTTRALILAGGGLFGISWETGIMAGLAEGGVDVRKADFYVGTSPGASAAVQVNSGLTYDQLFQMQIDPEFQNKELRPRSDVGEKLGESARIRSAISDPVEARQRIGQFALETQTVNETDRLEVIASRLVPYNLLDWPAAHVAITAVDLDTGERVMFDQESGVPLDKAIAASSALPGAWPPITIGDKRYIDGGVYSIENADLAAGYDRVLIIQPLPISYPETSLDKQISQLEAKGSHVKVIAPGDSLKSILTENWGNALDPAIKPVAARLGREQGLAEAAGLAQFWN